MERILIRSQDLLQGIPAEVSDNQIGVGYTAVVLSADAQATIAALQARVRELEQWVQDQSTANLEKMRHTDEMQSRAMEAESQLTQRTAQLTQLDRTLADVYAQRDGLQKDLAQRTAELEAVNKHCEIIEERKAEAYKEVEIQLLAKANLQAELERVRGERDHAKKMEAVQKEVADNQTWHVQKLRTLIAALPYQNGGTLLGRVESLVADHARVLGLVQALPVAHGNYSLTVTITGPTRSMEIADAVEALLTYRASLPAQPAQGGA